MYVCIHVYVYIHLYVVYMYIHMPTFGRLALTPPPVPALSPSSSLRCAASANKSQK